MRTHLQLHRIDKRLGYTLDKLNNKLYQINTNLPKLQPFYHLRVNIDDFRNFHTKRFLHQEALVFKQQNLHTLAKLILPTLKEEMESSESTGAPPPFPGLNYANYGEAINLRLYSDHIKKIIVDEAYKLGLNYLSKENSISFWEAEFTRIHSKASINKLLSESKW